MTLVLYRIDDRLIHGQVVVGWGQPLDIEFIVLVDDTVADAEWEQELYRMGVPPELEVVFQAADDAINTRANDRSDTRAGILLTGDIATMSKLAAASGISTVNIGGLHSRAGRVQKLRYVFLAPDEERELRALAARGVAVTAQDVPTARPVSLEDVLSGSES